MQFVHSMPRAIHLCSDEDIKRYCEATHSQAQAIVADWSLLDQFIESRLDHHETTCQQNSLTAHRDYDGDRDKHRVWMKEDLPPRIRAIAALPDAWDYHTSDGVRWLVGASYGYDRSGLFLFPWRPAETAEL